MIDWRRKLSGSQHSRISGMLGLAMRAGKLIVGTEQVCLALRKRGHLHLVVVSSGASEATRKKLEYKCEFYNVRLIETGLDTGEVGRLLGKTYAPACVGITDEGFAKAIEKLD